MKKIVLIVVAALALGGTVFATSELLEQRDLRVSGDFRNAAVAELRDDQGNALMRGTFTVTSKDNSKDSEREAKLAPIDGNSKATGSVEVEYENATPDVQEVELKVQGLTPDAQVTLMIDTTQVAIVKADRKGKIDQEIQARPSTQQ